MTITDMAWHWLYTDDLQLLRWHKQNTQAGLIYVEYMNIIHELLRFREEF